MTDIQSAILWWEEWQLRILVLGSLGLQWFLLVTAPMRKYTICSCFRRCIWLAYISSDALAIYALATLFNRHARTRVSAYNDGGGYDDASKWTSLEVLWAPLLLVHLGGRDEITAFNIQDNDMWTRHTVTVVSQVTVALYAFYKSWPPGADRRLLVAAIMLFVNGVINFCEKPWALRNASMNRMEAMSAIIEGERRKTSRWERCFTEVDDSYRCCGFRIPRRQNRNLLSPMEQVQAILSDLSLLAAAGGAEKKKKVLAQLPPDVQMTPWLRRAFELIYTRANVVYAPAYIACDFLLVPALYMAAITLFAVGDKQGYSPTDVKMTYIFMALTAVLDALGVFIGKLVYRLMSKTRIAALCMTLRRYNLIDSVAWRMKPREGCLRKLICRLGYEDHSESSRFRSSMVADFVVFKLLKPKEVEGLDLASYRCLEKHNWVLGNKLRAYMKEWEEKWQRERERQPEKEKSRWPIRRSLCESPFDESVLIWHIATDLCFRGGRMPGHEHEAGASTSTSTSSSTTAVEESTKTISNYMGYLLMFRPAMLMTGSRPLLFTLAMKGLEKQVQLSKGGPLLGNRRQRSSAIIDVIMNHEELFNEKKYRLIHEARQLYQELQRMDEEMRRELMFGVWLGMLCYSASMCRGYLHAKSLGEGGEFLTYVWIVISLKGAKTLADKLQMSSEEFAAPSGSEVVESEEDIRGIFSL